MNYPTLIEYAKQVVPLLPYIESTTGIKATKYGSTCYIKPCPFCGSNTKHHFSIKENENYYKSFKDCVPGGTIIDFMIHYEKLSKAEAIKKLLELANLTHDLEEKKMYSANVKKKSTKDRNEPLEIDYTDLIEKAHANVEQTTYYVERGLTSKTINKYKLGYVEEGFAYAIKNHSAIEEKESASSSAYKYYLPIWNHKGKCSYFLTRIDDSEKKDLMHKMHNLKNRPIELLNERYLLDNKPHEVLFIVEGYFDALSIEEIDFPAIALNSVVNVNKLSKLVKENYQTLSDVTFVVIPDNDEAGAKLIENINSKFQNMEINYILHELPKEYKDVNEFLIDNRGGLKLFIESIANRIMRANRGDFLINHLDSFTKLVQHNNFQPISTHFQTLDMQLNGGLFPGLYIIGGPTSVGKTAFVHQIADQVASSGTPVFYFSYEMSRVDLIARSLSRFSLLKDAQTALTDVEIKTGKASMQTSILIEECYKNIAQSLEIYEGRFGENIISIENKIERLKKYHNSFLVIIDYLQIVNASKTSLMGERSTIDTVVTKLKQISRDYQIPVLAISSFNRSNYNLPVGFESFKESGIIEYSSDVLMGLQFRDIHQLASQRDEQKKRELIERWKQKYPRELELQILKNRFGNSSSQIKFNYYAKHQLIKEG